MLLQHSYASKKLSKLNKGRPFTKQSKPCRLQFNFLFKNQALIAQPVLLFKCNKYSQNLTDLVLKLTVIVPGRLLPFNKEQVVICKRFVKATLSGTNLAKKFMNKKQADIDDERNIKFEKLDDGNYRAEWDLGKDEPDKLKHKFYYGLGWEIKGRVNRISNINTIALF